MLHKMAANDAFKPQLDDERAFLTERYFNLTNADRERIDKGIAGSPPMTDADWEKFKVRRLTTSLGTKKQIGDRMLYAAVMCQSKTDQSAFERCIEVFVDREFTIIEEMYNVYVDGTSILPMLVKK